MTPGDFNGRQKFDARGLLWQIMELDAGGYMVVRFERADPMHCIVSSAPLETMDNAIAEAERLRKAALI